MNKYYYINDDNRIMVVNEDLYLDYKNGKIDKDSLLNKSKFTGKHTKKQMIKMSSLAGSIK